MLNIFSGCSGLTSVTIPNSVTRIGYEAFKECSHLTSFVIGNSVTSIGSRAFYMSRFTSITIPNSVTSIGDEAFKYSSLKSVTFHCQHIGDWFSALYMTEITIGDEVTSIDSRAFRNCSKLTSVTIGNRVTSIGYEAFYGCSDLLSVKISDVTAWCNIKFKNYSANPLYYAHHLYLNGEEIKDLVIPNGVMSIGDYAYPKCSDLISVTIPNSVTSIGDGAFEDCFGLTSVKISDVAAWCNIKFENYSANPLYYAHHLYLNGKEIKDLVIPNGVTSIVDYAFYRCSDLMSVTIPNSVTSIGWCAFSDCSDLTSVTIGKGVTKIDSYAFSDCDIPLIVSLIENPFSINGNTFTQNTFYNATLYVPIGTKEKYKATAGWKIFLFIEEGAGGGGGTSIDNSFAKTMQVLSNGGTINVQGCEDGERVSVYSINGNQVGTTVSQNGAATINTTLQPGRVAIVKIGQKSVKVIMK